MNNPRRKYINREEEREGVEEDGFCMMNILAYFQREMGVDAIVS